MNGLKLKSHEIKELCNVISYLSIMTIMKNNQLSPLHRKPIFRPVENGLELSTSLLGKAKLWFDLVKETEPFADNITELYELDFMKGKKGDGLGFFSTPDDISNLIIKLQNINKERKSEIYDMCCGTGSLCLASLRSDHNNSYMLNDMDELMTSISAMQILSNIATHKIYPKDLTITNSNALLCCRDEDLFLDIHFRQ